MTLRIFTVSEIIEKLQTFKNIEEAVDYYKKMTITDYFEEK